MKIKNFKLDCVENCFFKMDTEKLEFDNFNAEAISGYMEINSASLVADTLNIEAIDGR